MSAENALFSGVYGGDSSDILNMPSIAFGTFQLFPDQLSYGVADPSLSTFSNIAAGGIAWIDEQAGQGTL